MGIPEPQCRSVTRAVDEAMTNIIRHAYGNQRNQPIELMFYRSQRVINGEPESGLEISSMKANDRFPPNSKTYAEAK